MDDKQYEECERRIALLLRNISIYGIQGSYLTRAREAREQLSKPVEKTGRELMVIKTT